MIGRTSLDARYFDDIFARDDDPWDLATSAYEAEKFARTLAAIADRRYQAALEIGCAHGVLTEKILPCCDSLLAIDISSKALAKAHKRVGDRPGLKLQQMAFPKQTPETTGFDLVLLSEVAYYWDGVDLDRAGEWLELGVAPGGRVLLAHYTGETDYPHSGDAAVQLLWEGTRGAFAEELTERHPRYRLDLWTRR
jgi:SAM-dependent methyltransferase